MTTDATAGPVITNFPGVPEPTPLTLAMRSNLLVQAVRFVAIDVRIMMMVLKGHED